MRRRLIRLSESDFYQVVGRAVSKVLCESYGKEIDWDHVDEIVFSCWYDDDDLQDAISNGDVDNTKEGINDWMYENLNFSIYCYDIDGNSLGGLDTTQDMMDYDGIPQDYIDLIVGEYNSNPQCNHEYRISDIIYDMANSCGNIDDACKKMFYTTDEYYKGAHGFVLKDGTIVIMPQGGDHNAITSVNGVESKWQFVEDGNPSILNNNLRVGGSLTYDQEAVIGKMIRCYSDDELYVDFLGGPKGEQTCKYSYPDYRRVFADIDRYYDDGIIPQGDGF